MVDALRCLPQEAALRALAHLAQAVSSIQISTVRSVPAYIMSIIAKHQPGREGRLRDNPRKPLRPLRCPTGLQGTMSAWFTVQGLRTSLAC